MSRLRTLLPLPLLALASACAPVRQPGALSPLGARVTNEVIGEDAQTLESWSRRVAALGHDAAAVPSPRRDYVAARAAAWLAYARDAYAWDPRDGAADTALAETRRLVLALEAGTIPELRPRDVLPNVRARPELWASLERARGGRAMQHAPAALAGAEVALVRASRLASGTGSAAPGARILTDAERACELQVQGAAAERLLNTLPGPTERAPSAVAVAPVPARRAAATVVLQGEPAPASAARRIPPLEAQPLKRGVERRVHFAVGSSELALASRATLGEVVAMLRSHPGVNVMIEGHTDARGRGPRNRELAVRRADAVRRFLDEAQVALGRVTIAGIGADSAAAVHASAKAFARDRRVTLTFTDADGTPLTPGAYQLHDVDHERDLQVERRRRTTSRGTRSAPRSPAASRSIPR
jgi:outer membrane protein OmpA-like peptidoglycan-associated protein